MNWLGKIADEAQHDTQPQDTVPSETGQTSPTSEGFVMDVSEVTPVRFRHHQQIEGDVEQLEILQFHPRQLDQDSSGDIIPNIQSSITSGPSV